MFGAVLLLVTASLISVAIAMHGQEPYAGIVSHLAAMFLAAFVATVFFSLRDVRESLAASVSNLLLDGDVVNHLSGGARRALARRILLAEITGEAESLPDTLYDHARKVELHLFAVPHLINYTPTVILADFEGEPELLKHSFRCTYTVSTRHLPNGRGIYSLRFRHEFSDPSGVVGKTALQGFEARVGDTLFTSADITVSERQSGGLGVTLLSLDRDIEVVGEAAVIISYEGIVSRRDPTEIFYAWYPTKGFRVTLLHSKVSAFDCAWFKSWTTVARDFPGREQVVLMPNGITAYTDEWLMPGHGVVLYWFERSTPRVVAPGEVQYPAHTEQITAEKTNKQRSPGSLQIDEAEQGR